jgi:hypothetical protein
VECSVAIPASAWQAVAADLSRLKTTLVVNGVPLHLDAIEVEVGEDGVQHASEEVDESVALIHSAVGADGHFGTLEIGGREYVLIATPFC